MLWGTIIFTVLAYWTSSELEARADGTPLVYFMPAQGGNCRFSQYSVFLGRLIVEKRLKNVALWSINSNDGYTAMSVRSQLNILGSIIVSDCMDDIRNAIFALARDREKALREFTAAEDKIVRCLENGSKGPMKILHGAARELSKIELVSLLHSAKKVLIAGEIYIRKDIFSSQVLVDRLAERRIVCKRSRIHEYLSYVDYYAQHLIESNMDFSRKLQLVIKQKVQGWMQKRIKSALARSGLYESSPVDIRGAMRAGRVS